MGKYEEVVWETYTMRRLVLDPEVGAVVVLETGLGGGLDGFFGHFG